MKMPLVLIVDDKEENLYLLRVLLQGNGYEVAEAHHGAEALAKARSNPPVLIVSDILMPVMDGFSLCREWKKDERLKSIPFVFYTATYTDERDRQFALSLGADRFVVKPQEPDAFLAIIRETVQQVAGHAAKAPEAAAPECLPQDEGPEEEAGFLKQYSETLIRKLETKMEQLERANQQLELDMAALRKASEALRLDSEMLSNIADGIQLTRESDLTIVYANPQFERMFGYGSGEVVGLQVMALNSPLVESPEAVVNGILRAVRCEGAWDGEILNVKKDGTPFWCHATVSGFAHPEHGRVFISTHQDITVRKQAEEALRESESRYRLLVDNAGEAVYVVQGGNVVFGNAAFTRWIGVGQSEVIGRSIEEFVSSDYLPTLKEDLRRVEAGERNGGSLEIKVRAREGAELWVSESSVPITWNGGPATLNLATDITERKQALAALETERNKLDLVTRNVGAGLAIISREYRTLWANDVLKKMFGTVEGKLCYNCYNQRDTICPECGVRRVFEQGEEIAVHEQSGQDANGQAVWSQIIATPIRGDNGEVTEALELVVPITERKRAEQALKESETLLNEVGQIAKIGGWEMNLIARTARWTLGTYEIVEIEPGEPVPGPDEHVDYYLPEDRHIVSEAMRALVEDDKPMDFEARLRTAKGNMKWCRAIGQAIRDGGRCIKVKGTFQDVTDRKLAEAALRESESKYRLLHESMRDAFVAVDMEGRILECNSAFEALVGYSKDELAQMTFFDFTPERWLDIEAKIIKEQILARGYSEVYEKEYRRKDGSIVPVELRAVVIRGATEEPVGMWGTVRDITERKRVIATLQESEARFRSLVEVAPECIFVQSESRFIFINPAALKLFGGECPEDLLGNDLMPRIAPEFRSVVLERIQHQRVTGKPSPLMDQEYLRLDGTRVPVEAVAVPIRFQGRDAHLVLARDVTARKQAEDTLREREEFLSSVIENIPDMVFIKDADELRFVRFNKAGEKLLGHAREELIGKTDYDFFPVEQADSMTQRDREVLASGQLRDIPEEPLDTPEGTRLLHTKKLPILGKNGKPAYLLGISEDITEHKREEAEREKLRMQLVQAQKMEAVGRLAGGVAHDFNNMLGVIMGYAELALHQVDPANSLYSNLEEIRRAAERSADLTRQLLAFARKQTVAPKVLDLNVTVEGMLKMLRRLIGEDIELAWIPGSDACPVKVDPSQIDQILANLCLNARDAIAGVGRVTIETQTVALDENHGAKHAGVVPGDYVMLAVSDDGCGMDEVTASKVFEPFFTTKELGKGTGLGLATVYGIVQQNDGLINVYSEPGQGTTFKIYLPQYAAKTEVMEKEAAAAPVARGRETILLVEDEPAILRLTTMMLERQGYSVLAASRPGEAIRIAREHAGVIHLLVTDVVMPEMNGRAMAKNLMTLYPGLKRLFMSGYTANVIAHRGVLDEGVHFIQKPFSMSELAAKVREALDGE